MQASTQRRTALPWQVNFVLLSAIWGSSFLFIKVAATELAAIDVSLGRIALGAALLLALVAVRRERLPRGGAVWLHLTVAGFLMNALPFTLFAWGEQRLSSVVAGLWNATTPLMVLVVAMLLLRDEPPSRRSVLGLLLGLTGAVAVLGPWRGLEPGELAAHVAFAAAAASYGIGTPYMRRHLTGRPEGPLALSAAQLLAATAMLAALAPFLGGLPTAVPSAGAIASVFVLGVLGTGIAYVLYYLLIDEAGATVASTVTYLMPVFSTALGVLVLSEPLRWNEPVGGVVILLGILVSTSTVQRRRREASTVAGEGTPAVELPENRHS